MTEPLAALNGRLVPISEAQLSIFDLGLVLGASITEMVRTFHHQPFHLDNHLQRLFRSLKVVGFPFDQSLEDLNRQALDVVAHNAPLIPDSHDLGIVVFVTAGQNLTYLGAAEMDRARTPSVCVHTFPLPFELWADKLERGQHLVTPSIRHIPADSLDPKIKSRSRLHWYLADQQARLVEPSAGAVLLDHAANVTETSTGNFFIVNGSTIRTPSQRTTLGGVSQQVVAELAGQLGLEFVATDLQVYDVLNADECFTSSTPYCLLPVTRFNGKEIGAGQPGPVFQQLTAAWSELVGLDISAQIRQGAQDRQLDRAQ